MKNANNRDQDERSTNICMLSVQVVKYGYINFYKSVTESFMLSFEFVCKQTSLEIHTFPLFLLETVSEGFPFHCSKLDILKMPLGSLRTVVIKENVSKGFVIRYF